MTAIYLPTIYGEFIIFICFMPFILMALLS